MGSIVVILDVGYAINVNAFNVRHVFGLSTLLSACLLMLTKAWVNNVERVIIRAILSGVIRSMKGIARSSAREGGIKVWDGETAKRT
jgi:hypothetical protein